MKIAINESYGGFGLSEAAIVSYATRKGIELWPERHKDFKHITWYTVPPEERVKELEGYWMDHPQEVRKAHNERYAKERFDDDEIPRDDPDLIATIELLGTDVCAGRYCSLKIVEIPDDVEWKIEEYDGLEWVAEKHRTWS